MKKSTTYKIKMLLCLLMLFPSISFSQQSGKQAKQKFERDFFPPSNPEWLTARQESAINPSVFFSEYGEAIGLTVNDEMKFLREHTDDLGKIHQRYQQYHAGYKVEGGEFILHSRAGKLETANGKWLRNFTGKIQINVSEEAALETAKQLWSEGDFMWLNPKMEAMVKEHRRDPAATYFPKGEWVWMHKEYNTGFNKQQFVLCMRFEIFVESGNPKVVFIEASSGKILHSFPLAASCNAGTGLTTWNGTINLNSHLYPPSDYVMWDDCAAPELVVRNGNGANGIGSWTDYHDFNNNWNAGVDQPVVQTYFGELMVYSFFYSQYGRWSYDNNGTWIVAYNNIMPFGTNDNACQHCYGTNEISFGNGSTASNTDNWNTLDIVGHEFTHGVYRSALGWNYQNEPGALNESFSDIFGEMTELWGQGSIDWLVGNQRTGGAIRSMSNPNALPVSDPDPDTYNGTNWATGTADNGGVHSNSGVQNYWFYLLTNGGSGTNDNNDDFSVDGIGWAAAAWITYWGYINYMTTAGNYVDAREATIFQANDSYGSCSYAAIQTGNAWYAAGVGTALATYNFSLCGNYPQGFNFNMIAINQLNVSISGCATNINPDPSTVNFTSAHEVNYYPGFTAFSGSNFNTYIDPCNVNSVLRTAPDIIPGSRPPVNIDAVRTVITSSGQPLLAVYPNPAINTARVDFGSTLKGEIVITLYSSLMNEIWNKKITIDIEGGHNSTAVDVTHLPAGMYFLKLDDGANTETVKLLKQ